jgi:hypothetical protein
VVGGGACVNDLTIPPASDHVGDLLTHQCRVAGEPGVVEGRLDETAQPAVLCVRAGGQAVAEDLAGLVEQRPALVEEAVVDQHLMQQVGVTHHVQRPRADPHRDQIPAGWQQGQKRPGVFDQVWQMADQRHPARRGPRTEALTVSRMRAPCRTRRPLHRLLAVCCID